MSPTDPTRDFDPTATADGPAPDSGLDAGLAAAFGGDSGSTADFPGKDERVGAILGGKYKLIEVIGEGGMGSVYMAQQTEPVKRKVAIKVIKAGMDSKAVLARFEAERQALAMMDHPNIAKVLDAGTTESGRPFFVMELVKGVPITEYCDERKLTPKQRLELFVPVCQAIQHAHQKGVIHRDIKPSNVLIALYDDKPVPKVIDFGVAKATGQSLTDKTLVTGFGAVVGTPEYMSPEQANLNNLDIDTRSDVYSLGVLLYELLTGSTPVDKKSLGKAALLEILRIVREVEAPKPSHKLSSSDALPSIAANRGTEPKSLCRMFRGELDWVVLKALEKDRARRYGTANGLARDIQRYLADEIVEARPPSTGYRLRKFVKRHKGQVLAAGLVFFALVAGVVGTAVGLAQANQARSDEVTQRGIAEEKERVAVAEKNKAIAAAEEERQAKLREAAQLAIAIEQRAKAEKASDRASKVLDTMTSEVTGNSLATQKAITDEQKKFLVEVLTYYKEFAGEKADDERSRERTAAAAYKVGLIEDRLGHKEESAMAFRMARDGYAALEADYPVVPAYRRDLAGCHGNLGLLLAALGKWAEAEAEDRKTLAIREKLTAEFPAIPAYRQELAGIHLNLGNLLVGLGNRVEAEGMYRKALAIQEKLAAEFPAVPAYHQDLARSHFNLGNMLAGLGKPAETKAEYRQALAIQEKLAATFPAVTAYRMELAGSYSNLGILLAGLGKQAEAEGEFRQALAIQEKLAADFPTVPEYRHALAGSHNNLGVLLRGLGKRVEAESEYKKALAIFEKLAAECPAVPAYRQYLGASHYNLGNLLAELGKRAEAEGEYRKALAIREKLAVVFPAVPDYHQDLAASHSNLGVLLGGLGRRAEAESEFRKALAIREKLAADFPAVLEYREEVISTSYNFACLCAITSGKEAGKKQEYADRAVEMLQKAVKAGYKDAAHMAADKDLDLLRERADFKKLIAELEKKFPPPPEVAPPPKAVK